MAPPRATNAGPPRKRALKAVPEIGKAARIEEAKKTEVVNGVALGKNKLYQQLQREHTSGPDLPPGVHRPWLPLPEEVPPKPKREPKMEYPGIGNARDGHGEWQLHTSFDPDDPMVPLGREWRIRWVPPDERRCIARSVGKSSQWMGNRCALYAIKGGKVCRYHGGNIPNVKKAAQAALAIAALPAAEKLIHIALNKRGVSDSDRIKAIIQILDRAGVEGKQTIEVELSLWQKTLQTVYSATLATEGEGAPGQELIEGEDYELDDEADDESDLEDGDDD